MKNFSQRRKNPSSAVEYVLKLLARRDYSEQELREKLLEHFDVDIEELITKLKERGLLSDERYAERLIDKYMRKRFGFLKIKSELLRKGIEPSLIESLLTKKYTKEKEIENAKYFLSKKPKEKLYSYLIQKGFRPHIVQEVLAQIH